MNRGIEVLQTSALPLGYAALLDLHRHYRKQLYLYRFQSDLSRGRADETTVTHHHGPKKFTC